ncbi:MAG: hypothetical protein LUQ25_01215 [Methanoregulaceae archaeon]|nr:hypothetical protein [Methanoregulaceae archaeon]
MKLPVFPVAFAAGALLLVPFSEYWYIQVSAAALFLAVLAWSLRSGLEPGFLLLCAGEPAVVAAGATNPWAAFALQVLLLGVLPAGSSQARGVIPLAGFTIPAALIFAAGLTARHTAGPLLVLAAASALAAVCIWLAGHRITSPLRRDYA